MNGASVFNEDYANIGQHSRIGNNTMSPHNSVVIGVKHKRLGGAGQTSEECFPASAFKLAFTKGCLLRGLP